MAGSLVDRVSCWIAWGGIDERFAPEPARARGRVSGERAVLPSRLPIRGRSPTGKSGTVINCRTGFRHG